MITQLKLFLDLHQTSQRTCRCILHGPHYSMQKQQLKQDGWQKHCSARRQQESSCSWRIHPQQRQSSVSFFTLRQTYVQRTLQAQSRRELMQRLQAVKHPASMLQQPCIALSMLPCAARKLAWELSCPARTR